MSILEGLDWWEIRSHYDMRVKESKNLRQYLEATPKPIRAFGELALGMSTPTGNYSAAERGLGPRILASNPNALGKVFDLATKFKGLTDGSTVPDIVQIARIIWLQIGVGSEISCMVNPTVCWVCNKRTIFTHLARTEGISKAKEALQLFNEGAADSAMAYNNWADAFHPELRDSLLKVAGEGASIAKNANIMPGSVLYLWADAIASATYDKYHPKR